MAASRRRRPLEIWPGFVDATASLLIVVIFALLLAIFGHLVLSTQLTERDEALTRLNQQINQLTDILSMEKAESNRLEDLLALRTENLNQANTQIDTHQQTIAKQETLLLKRESTIEEQTQAISQQIATAERLKNEIAALEALRDRIQSEIEQKIAENDDIREKLLAEKKLNIAAQAQLELLNQQIAELGKQLTQIANALDIAEQDIKDKAILIEDLGTRLNTALASKAQILQRYRSEFFGRLRDALSNYPGIRIEGDRFVFPSELLFESASAKLGPTGQKQVSQLANTLKEISLLIPDDIDWILRVDGHTDKRPLKETSLFASNWELSSARAISIVRLLIQQGIPAKRIAATGFAEHHPSNPSDSAEAYALNRRIEIKLTSR